MIAIMLAGTTAMLGLGWFVVFTLPLPAFPTIVIVAVTMFSAGVGWVNLTTLLATSTSGLRGSICTSLAPVQSST